MRVPRTVRSDKNARNSQAVWILSRAGYAKTAWPAESPTTKAQNQQNNSLALCVSPCSPLRASNRKASRLLFVIFVSASLYQDALRKKVLQASPNRYLCTEGSTNDEASALHDISM